MGGDGDHSRVEERSFRWNFGYEILFVCEYCYEACDFFAWYIKFLDTVPLPVANIKLSPTMSPTGAETLCG